MQNNIEEIIELLNLWKEYKAKKGVGFGGFANWLSTVYQEPKTSFAAQHFDKEAEPYFENSQDEHSVLNTKISMLWGRLDRYKHLLIKKAFRELPIKTVEEFVLLIYLKYYPNPQKSDFIKSTHFEPTTTFEMIKRLVRQGFVKEARYKKDKRSKSISLSEEGAEVLEKAKTEMEKVTKILVGNMPLEDKKQIAATFDYLNNFHQKIYEDLKDETLQKIIDEKINK